MRLLNVCTFEFSVFYTNVPEYVIASHRWLTGQDVEASFQDVKSGERKETAGYQKVEDFAAYVRKYVPEVKWLWIDTCCINKQDAQELSEAINSMFRWYDRAAVCIAHLADVEVASDLESFEKSEWFSRGWTLQEMLAPDTVVFMTRGWDVIGHKGKDTLEGSRRGLLLGPSLEHVISSRTRIPAAVLHDWGQSGALGRKQKLKWMRGRATTREEDMVYCLFGILDVAMVSNYGEGRERAQRRLQRAIATEDLPLVHEDLFDDRSELRNIPPPRDPDHVDRKALMRTIICKMERPAARIALVGLGGVGKSQLANQFANNYREESPESWTIWLDASSASRFRQSLREFALANVPGAQDPRTNISKLLRLWLWNKRNGSWLIIVDNADDEEYLLETTDRSAPFPLCDHGDIIVTSRSHTAAESIVPGCEIIPVPSLDCENALTLLDRKLGPKTTTSEENTRVDLVTALNFVPLAITQAAYFLASEPGLSSLSDYVKTIETMSESLGRLSNVEVDDKDIALDGVIKLPILMAWQVSFEQIFRTRRSAAELLALISLCDGDPIPDGLFNQPGRDLEHDVHVLKDFSFITTSHQAYQSCFMMRGLIRLAVRRWLIAHGTLSTYMDQLIETIDEAFPGGEEAEAEICELLLPHAWSLVNVRPQGSAALLRWANLMDKTARYLHSIERHRGFPRRDRTVRMSEHCVEARIRSLGDHHPDTLASLDWLAEYHDRFGNYSKAASIKEQIFTAKKKQMGEDHPQTLQSMSHLAEYYYSLGKRDVLRAVELGEQCLRMRKEYLGEEHNDTVTSANSLELYRSTQRQSDPNALETMKRCWEIRRQQLGEDHPDTLSSMHSVAQCHNTLGECEQAKLLAQSCWKAREKHLGTEHTATLRSMSDFALCCYNLKDLTSAVTTARPCWEARKRQLGEEHDETLESGDDLAFYYREYGRCTEAAEIIKRCRMARKRHSGSKYADTVWSMSNSAWYSSRLGDNLTAAKIAEQCWIKSKEQLGEEHPETLEFMQSLAWYHHQSGSLENAIRVENACWELRRKKAGENDLHTLLSKVNLTRYRKAIEATPECTPRTLKLAETRPRERVSNNIVKPEPVKPGIVLVTNKSVETELDWTLYVRRQSDSSWESAQTKASERLWQEHHMGKSGDGQASQLLDPDERGLESISVLTSMVQSANMMSSNDRALGKVPAHHASRLRNAPGFLNELPRQSPRCASLIELETA